MKDDLAASGAAWIWSDRADRPYNNFVCFRRQIDVTETPRQAELWITADSRYEVYVNGQWIGHGPPRAWDSPWPVDRYDIRAALTPGHNTIAVLVQHFGIGTFQYLHGLAGLLARASWTDDRGGHSAVTDASWRCTPHLGYAWPVPRISCMQAWEEQFDARQAPTGGDWTARDFDDRAWPAATVLRLAGIAPHQQLQLRDIPPLTRDTVRPARLIDAQVVRPARYAWTLNPRDLLDPHDKTANCLRGLILLVSHVHSPRRQTVQLHCPHHRPAVDWKLNGRSVRFDDHKLQETETGVAHATLQRGWNTLMARLPLIEHYWWASINVWADAPLRFSAFPDARNEMATWSAVGPIAPEGPIPEGLAPPGQSHFIDCAKPTTPDQYRQVETVWQCGAVEPDSPPLRPLTSDMVALDDVYARCASERPVPRARLRIEDADHLLSDGDGWTTIYPHPRGDVRILLDFGKELVGFHELEIDAPAGTVVDDHNFEFIQPDGRKNLAEGMNNSFRYVCRKGVQRYRTFVRRGFRYSWLTFRNFDRPIRVRRIHVLLSTYPQARRGAFACSDERLNQIWDVGAHSVRCCSEDTYTDCPTYEQTFWVGDARNEALVDLVVNGDARLSAHSWLIAAESLQRSPIVESQVPSAWQCLLPTWSFLWMRWAYEHHLLTGDDALARRMIPYLDRNARGIEHHRSKRGLFNMPGWNMFDWAAMDTPSGGEVTHLNCLAVLGLRETAMLAERVGRKRHAVRWRELADQLAKSVNRHLWDARKRAYVDCIRPDGKSSPVFSQQTQTAAYIAGVAIGVRGERCRQIMERPPIGFVRTGSPFFMFFLLEAFARQNRIESVVDVIRSYWGKQVENGATTFWETYHPDEPRMTRSHCHGWSAAPTFFLTQHVLGVRPITPGYEVVQITPPPLNLSWARGRVPTPRGEIGCAWESCPQKLTLCLSLPPRTTARIELPFLGDLTLLHGTTTYLRRSGNRRPELVTHSAELSLTLLRRAARPKKARTS